MKNIENSFRKGSIYLTEFPFTDIKHSKIRPVVVLLEDPKYDDVTVMAISSALKRTDEPQTILVSPTHNEFNITGLKKESVILTKRIATIKKSHLFFHLGYLTQRYLDELDEVLLNELGIGYETKKKEEKIPYGKQSIDSKDVFSVIKTLRSDWLTQGPKIPEFEERLAEYCGAKYAVVFNSGTSALHGAYFAIGLKKGDELITSPITFVATANAGLYLGANPVFVDVEKNTGNIDITKNRKKDHKKDKTSGSRSLCRTSC